MTTTDAAAPPHPATWSTPVLAEVVRQCTRHVGPPAQQRPLDPFAGVATKLYRHFPRAVGVEIEPEWAGVDRRTIVADATRLPFRYRAFNLAISSPTYGNRLADHHNAQERCQLCAGTGQVAEPQPGACPRCGGAGRNRYVRHTYAHSLGRRPHQRSTAAMQWGPDYRALHGRAWVELAKVLAPGAIFILNVSDHYRGGKRVHVTAWHISALRTVGFELVEAIPIPTRRQRHGANGALRLGYEVVATLRLSARPSFEAGIVRPA